MAWDEKGVPIAPGLMVPWREIELKAIRASGPGGQNVNKVATAVQLRFQVVGSPSLPEGVARRLAALAGSRLSGDGVLVIDARNHRTQEQNRQEALHRLVTLLRQALRPPKRRVATKPTLAAKRRRLEAKRQRAETKRTRRYRPGGDA